MIRRIELINFMSHPHTVIEPADGLTVLVGDNNTGKSAVIAALQILARNTSGDFMVRHGEKECRIIVTTDDGHELQWCRKGRAVSYTIDGREVHRLRGSVPEDLHNLLRLSLVETEGEPFDVHFGEQKKPIFLLDDSPGRRATFFASSSDAIRLIEMQGRHRRKVQDAKASEVQLVRDAARLDARIDALSQLPKIGGRLEQLEKSHSALLAEADQISGLSQAILRLCETKQLKIRWVKTSAALGPLPAPPEPVPTDPLRHRIQEMAQCRSRIRKNTAAAKAVKSLSPPPEIVDTRLLADLVERVTVTRRQADRLAQQKQTLQQLSPPFEPADTQRLADRIARITDVKHNIAVMSARHEVFDRAHAPPEIPDTAGLHAMISRLAAAEGQVAAAVARAAHLANLRGLPEAVDDSGLRDLISRIDAARKQAANLRADRDAVAKDHNRIQEELRRCIIETGICPTCGQVMDPDHIMEMTTKTDGGIS